MIGKFKVGVIVQCTASDLYSSLIDSRNFLSKYIKNTKS